MFLLSSSFFGVTSQAAEEQAHATMLSALSAARAAGPSAVVALLRLHPGSALVQEEGWRAVGDLASGTTVAGSILSSSASSAFSLAASAAGAGPGARGGPGGGSSGGGSDSGGSRGGGSGGGDLGHGRAAAAELGRLGACELVVGAMARHGGHLGVQCQGCRALYLLAWDLPANHERLGKAGACEALVQV